MNTQPDTARYTNAARCPHESSSREWRFDASDARAACKARREVADFIRHAGGDSEGAESSELIVGELLANTVEHAPGPVEVAIGWIANQPVLIVRDTGPGLGTFSATLPEDMMDEGGRGLFLVHALATKVTVVAAPTGGAELHVVLPMTRRSEHEPCRNSGA